VQELPTLPVREALGKLELLAVTSLFANQTTALAHAVIPALGFAEKAGSFTNHQGRIQRIARALTPPGACRSLGEILRAVAQHLGWDLGNIEPERVWAAIGEMPGPYQGIGWREWGEIGPGGATAEEVRSATRLGVGLNADR
jgi:predicted molibdopterin-dependent oxidoreductase YjgC